MAKSLTSNSLESVAGTSSSFLPEGRRSHSAHVISDKLYVWGGYFKSLPKVHWDPIKERLLSEVQIFHLQEGRWQTAMTRGIRPLGVRGHASAVLDDCILYFGGYCGHDDCFHNSLKIMNVNELVWTDLVPQNVEDCPMEKEDSCMVPLTFDDKKYLLIVGGYGPSSTTNHSQAKNTSKGFLTKYYRTNEQHYFNIASGNWIIPVIIGQNIHSCDSFTLTALTGDSAILFGGASCNDVFTDKLYIGQFTESTITWQRITTSLTPEGRYGHAAVGLDEHCVVIAGGNMFGVRGVCNCWLFNARKRRWKQLTLPDKLANKYYHSLSAWTITPDCVWLIIYGGRQIHTECSERTTIIEIVFEKEWYVSDVLTTLNDYQGKLSERRQLWENSAHGRLVKLQHIQEKMQEKFEEQSLRSENKEERHSIEESQLFLQQSLSLKCLPQNINDRSMDCVYHDIESHWIVNNDEIIMTDEILGKGSFGVVSVAKFRGLRVAAKCLHSLVISDYNLSMFSREMIVASRVRHPNLVQFIGATKLDNPIILTELMSTSLFKELQQKALTQKQILGISIDVALGLNYLHLSKPFPIIHRDISSPNVLLDPSIGDTYKAKIADYGTASLQQKTGTVMPGNPVYAAPESRFPDYHTTSMDVYSYCVVLMEMALHCEPVTTSGGREEQAMNITWLPIKALVQSGIRHDYTLRPDMNQILQALENICF